MVRVRHIWPALLLVAAATARSGPGGTFSVQYSAADGLYPEQCGWDRYTNEGGDQRWFENGWLVMDGMANTGIQDYYGMQHSLGPVLPGEELFVRWRILVDTVQGYHDPWVAAFADDKWAVSFVMRDNAIESTFEQFVSAPFEAGMPHTFELRSSDIRHYVLSIDGLPALEGSFWHSLWASQVYWGDGVSGSASLARWNFLEFGVVPEASAVALLAAPAALLRLKRTERR